ncbi:hypothetical protein BaRGS_00020039, partial [Batillaria attramentaria]
MVSLVKDPIPTTGSLSEPKKLPETVSQPVTTQFQAPTIKPELLVSIPCVQGTRVFRCILPKPALGGHCVGIPSPGHSGQRVRLQAVNGAPLVIYTGHIVTAAFTGFLTARLTAARCCLLEVVMRLMVIVISFMASVTSRDTSVRAQLEGRAVKELGGKKAILAENENKLQAMKIPTSVASSFWLGGVF